MSLEFLITEWKAMGTFDEFTLCCENVPTSIMVRCKQGSEYSDRLFDAMEDRIRLVIGHKEEFE